MSGSWYWSLDELSARWNARTEPLDPSGEGRRVALRHALSRKTQPGASSHDQSPGLRHVVVQVALVALVGAPRPTASAPREAWTTSGRLVGHHGSNAMVDQALPRRSPRRRRRACPPAAHRPRPADDPQRWRSFRSESRPLRSAGLDVSVQVDAGARAETASVIGEPSSLQRVSEELPATSVAVAMNSYVPGRLGG